MTNFVHNTSGATAIEYGLVAGLITLVIIGTLTTIGPALVAAITPLVAGLG